MSSEKVDILTNETTPAPTVEVGEITTKRAREDAEATNAGEDGADSANMAGRPVPPPLKFVTSEAAEPKAPAQMVRIKSRASLSSPTTPAQGLASLKINSPTVAPPAASGLKILSPTARSPTGSSAGARFGSPTDSTSKKSPQRYSTFANTANNASAASSAISQDPKDRYTTLFSRLLAQDEGADAAKAKEAAAGVAEALMKVPESVRTERTKTLLHHLNDAKNKDLRASVRDGTVSGEDFVTMDIRKLMNPEKQQEVLNKLEWSEKDRNLTELAAAKKISSTLFECPKCKKRDCTFYEKQTRSADEPMTQFFNCNVCKHNWKIY